MHVKGGRTCGSSRESCGDDGRLGRQQRKRALDEAVALGGLRNPRKSVEKRLAALLSGHIVDEILSEVCGSTQDGLDSLGDEASLVALTAAANETQGMLAEWVKVSIKERGVQHESISAIAGAVNGNRSLFMISTIIWILPQELSLSRRIFHSASSTVHIGPVTTRTLTLERLTLCTNLPLDLPCF